MLMIIIVNHLMVKLASMTNIWHCQGPKGSTYIECLRRPQDGTDSLLADPRKTWLALMHWGSGMTSALPKHLPQHVAGERSMRRIRVIVYFRCIRWLTRPSQRLEVHHANRNALPATMRRGHSDFVNDHLGFQRACTSGSRDPSVWNRWGIGVTHVAHR